MSTEDALYLVWVAGTEIKKFPYFQIAKAPSRQLIQDRENCVRKCNELGKHNKPSLLWIVDHYTEKGSQTANEPAR